jgi:hypothetical protein
MTLFYTVQPKRILALKGEKFQGEEGCKERVTFLLICSADVSEKVCSLIVSRFGKPHCLKGLGNYPCDSKSYKNACESRGLFLEWLVLFKMNMVLLMDQCAAHSDGGITLQYVHASCPTAKHHQYLQPLSQGIIYCMKRAYQINVLCFLL